MNLNSNNPLVTVAMVTYNSAKYVEAAISSVLSSSYENFELIIIDDCSTDSTWEIIGSFEEKRIRAIRNTSNLREYKNRNQCIQLANGKYFIFIDGDDILFEHGLANYVYYAEKYVEAGMLVQKGYTNNVIFPVMLEPRETFELEFFGKGLLSSSFVSNFFKTEILRSLGGLSEEYRAGDNFIRYLIACKYKVLFISGWNAWHRETPGQVSVKIQNGTGLAEQMKLLKQFGAQNLFPLDKAEKKFVAKRYNNIMSRLVAKNLLKGNFALVQELTKLAGFTLKDFVLRAPKPEKKYAKWTSGQPLHKKG